LHKTCIILLHLPNLTSSLSNTTTLTSSESYQICLQAANEMTDILERIMSTNPHFHYISVFISFCIFHAALIHLTNAQLVKDDIQIQQSQHRLGRHLLALQGCSKCKSTEYYIIYHDLM